MKRLLQFCAVVSLVLLQVGNACAQTETSGATPSGSTPGAPAGSYALSGFDNVNLFNGHLNFNLPLLGVSGRGAAYYQMSLPIEQTWTVWKQKNEITGAITNHPEANWWAGIKPGYGPGVMQGRKTGFGSVNCGQYQVPRYSTALTRLTFTAGGGTEYELRDQLTGGEPKQPLSCSVGFNRGRVFVTADGSSATFISDTDVIDRAQVSEDPITPLMTGYLLLRDGTRYRFVNGTVAWLRDRNGNTLDFTYDGYKRVSLITDSLGRQITVTYAAQIPGSDVITFKGFGGQIDRTISVNYNYLQNALHSGQTLQTYRQLFPELHGSTSIQHNPVVVASVTQPNNQQYQFYYNSYNELARIVLPTEGAIEYDYATGLTDGYASGSFGGGTTKHVYRRVIERRIYPTGGTGSAYESKTTYSRPETMTTNAGYVVVDQCTPSGTTGQCDEAPALLSRQHHYFYGSVRSSFSGLPTSYSAWNEGKEYQTEVYDTNGTTLLRRVWHNWQPNGTMGGNSVNARVTETVTTLADTNQVTKQTFAHDSHNNQTDVWEYDYGAGAPPAYAVRHAHIDYLALNPANNINYSEPASGGTYALTDPHLRSLPKAQQVYAVNPSNGTETLVAKSETLYDETAYLLPPYGGAVSGWVNPNTVDPNTSTRGNATTSRRWLDTSGTWLETHTQYDQTGNVRYARDARGNISEIEYSATYHYAFPTLTRSAIPDPANDRGTNTPLVSTSVYDLSTGRVTSTKDANGQVNGLSTTYEYNDALGRLTKVNTPEGGWTEYIYNDVAGDLYMRTLTAMNGSQSVESRQYFDGIGRPVRSFLYDGTAATPWSVADTSYDPLGRVWKVSNPYRVAAPGALVPATCAACTTSVYDALGRVSTVTTPDNAQVSTAYSGNEVTVTDQAGKKRKSIADGLGRLRQVVEAPEIITCQADGAGCATTYEYDVLGNLRKVNQGGQLRFFMYDSLSQLIRAKNPEQGNFTSDTDFPALTDATSGTINSQWSVGYTYDANGNLSKRKDARNITTTHTYDPLNRVLDTGYSDGVTLGVGRVYDKAFNGRGRFAWNWTFIGPNGANSHTAVDTYDAMGRVTAQRQHFWVNGAWGEAYTVSRTYDLAGHVTSQIYPSGHTANYPEYDAAGRLKKFNGNLGDGTQRTYATGVNPTTNVEEGIQYDEAGRLSQEKFGTQTALYHKQRFNSRGQLSDIRLGLGFDISSMERGAVTINYGTTANNGDVVSQQNWIPTNESATNWDIRQTNYAYDGLNRLTGMQEYYGTPGMVAQQWFTYDRWGNRQINAAATTDTLNEKQFEMGHAAATNRLLAPGDLARTENMRWMRYDDAGNLIEDSYTGAGARAYDAENRMTSAVIGINSSGVYTYDADGQRVRRQTPNEQVWQVYGIDGELLAEYAANASHSAPQKEYGYRNGELLITATGGNAAGGGAGINLAQGKFATQSSTEYGGVASRAVDGNTSGNWADGSVTHTGTEGAPWWQVDLGSVQQIGDIKVWNRTDCCGAVLTNFYVFVSDNPFAPSNVAAQAGVSTYPVAGQAGTPTVVAANRTGRYVRVQLGVWERLSLAEVQVFGAAAAVQKLSVTSVSASSTNGTDAPALAVDGNEATSWIASGFPTQWIELDLGQARSVSKLRLKVNQYPGGATTHQISGGTTQGALTPLWTQSRTLQAGEWLEATFAETSVRYLRVTTTSSPSWVAWFEIEVYGASVGGGSNGAGEVNWLVTDHLGTPRMIADLSGNLSGIKRHDYLPFGEEVGAEIGGRTAGQGYAGDNVRQQFTGYERDDDTGLDFAQARYYGSPQGRFTSIDPLYFQAMMTIDPQRFNLYAYARNNPFKWTDPTGEKLHLRGNANWLRTNVLYEMAGGQETFDAYFHISNGQVVLNEGVSSHDLLHANQGVQELAGLVNATENYVYFAGTDGEAAADLFQGSRDERGRLTSDGRHLSQLFTGTGRQTTSVGTLIGTSGRADNQPANLANGDPVFAVIAYNTNAVQEQIGVSEEHSAEMESQRSGVGQHVRPVSFFIHESAEKREFARQGGRFDYASAHAHAQQREAVIRRQLHITGGFAGGALRTTVPRTRR